MSSVEGRLEAYVRRLHGQLDTATVTATLTLMAREARAAIERQRLLIALERTAQRNIAGSLNELQILERVKAALGAALLRESGLAQEDIDGDLGTVVPLRLGASNRGR